jgi:hypothetical protein
MVRLNGSMRATGDVDVWRKPRRANSEKIICAISFLPFCADLASARFEPPADGAVENIRLLDKLLQDLLFSANSRIFGGLQ